MAATVLYEWMKKYLWRKIMEWVQTTLMQCIICKTLISQFFSGLLCKWKWKFVPRNLLLSKSEEREHDMHNKLKIVHNNPPLNTLHAAARYNKTKNTPLGTIIPRLFSKHHRHSFYDFSPSVCFVIFCILLHRRSSRDVNLIFICLDIYEEFRLNFPNFFAITPWRADKTTEIYHLFFFSLPIHRKSAFIKNSNQQNFISLNISTERESCFLAKIIFLLILNAKSSI